MSALAPVMETIEVKQVNLSETLEVTEGNPRDPRWCLNTVLRDKVLNVRECGIGRVPLGRFFPVASFVTPQENHTTDETKPLELMGMVTAADCEAVIAQAIAGQGAQSQVNWGAEFGFLNEKDQAKMAVISKTILPPLSTIHEWESADGVMRSISPICPGQDAFDAGSREECPTCWQQWLASESCTDYCMQIVQDGMEVRMMDNGQLVIRIVKPSLAEMDTARAMAVRSVETGLKTLRKTWSDISRELEQGKIRQGISDIENSYRKDLHEVALQDQPFEIHRKIAEANGTNNTGAVMASMVETQNLLAQAVIAQGQAQQQTNTLLSDLKEGLLANTGSSPDNGEKQTRKVK